MRGRCRFASVVLMAALGVAGALPAPALAQADTKGEPRKLTVGAIAGLAVINTFPLSVAFERGYFKEENLDVEVITQSNITSSCSSLITSTIDIGQCTINEMIPIDQKGGHLVQFHGIYQFANPYAVMVPSTITTWSQLKGKTVMLSAPKDITVYFFEQMAKAHGLTPNDLTYAYSAASGARLAALTRGAVEATVLSEPVRSLSQTQGMRELDASLKYFPAKDFAGGGWITSTNWLASHRDVALAWIRATEKAVRWINDPGNKNDVLALMVTTYKLPNDGIARQIYSNLISAGFYSPTGCTNLQAFRGNVKMLVDMGLIAKAPDNLAEFAPNTFVEAANGRRCR